MTDLRKAPSNEFNPDWNQVEALQESLREHMAEIQRLRQALAQPEQEPVAWINKDGWFRSPKDADAAFRAYAFPLYTAPPKREWVGLTDEEIEEYKWMGKDVIAVIKEIQATLKEKNT